jgi:hypothetical protein
MQSQLGQEFLSDWIIVLQSAKLIKDAKQQAHRLINGFRKRKKSLSGDRKGLKLFSFEYIFA